MGGGYIIRFSLIMTLCKLSSKTSLNNISSRTNILNYNGYPRSFCKCIRIMIGSWWGIFFVYFIQALSVRSRPQIFFPTRPVGQVVLNNHPSLSQ